MSVAAAQKPVSDQDLLKGIVSQAGALYQFYCRQARFADNEPIQNKEARLQSGIEEARARAESGSVTCNTFFAAANSVVDRLGGKHSGPTRDALAYINAAPGLWSALAK